MKNIKNNIVKVDTKKNIANLIDKINDDTDKFFEQKNKINKIMSHFENEEEKVYDKLEEILFKWLEEVSGNLDFSNDNKCVFDLDGHEVYDIAMIPCLFSVSDNKLEELLNRHFTGKIKANVIKKKISNNRDKVFVIFTYTGLN